MRRYQQPGQNNGYLRHRPYLRQRGNDRVLGLAGNDFVDGFGGNDVIYGGAGGDGNTGNTLAPFSGTNLEGAEDSDVVYGGDGDDFIDAAANDVPLETADAVDRSIGGAGDDMINAADGNVDKINCGEGGGDIVVMDAIDTAQSNCETSQAP